MLANGGILNRRRLLKAETVRLMTSNQISEMAPRGTGQGFLVGTVEPQSLSG